MICFCLFIFMQKNSLFRNFAKIIFLTHDRVVVILSILAILAAISLGRAGFGSGQALTGRYTEFTMCLLPFIIVFIEELELRPLYSKVFIGSVIAISALGLREMKFKTTYQEYYMSRLEGRNCVIEKLNQTGPALCPKIYPRDIRENIEIAKLRGLSFTKEN